MVHGEQLQDGEEPQLEAAPLAYSRENLTREAEVKLRGGLKEESE
jgi:hypothetical protein